MRVPKQFNPHPFPYHHELEITIDTLTNLGIGLGRVEGWVVMVPFALPGERIKARVYRNHKNYSDADLIGCAASIAGTRCAAVPFIWHVWGVSVSTLKLCSAIGMEAQSGGGING